MVTDFCSDRRTVLFFGDNILPTSGFSIKPLRIKLLAGEQKVIENSLSAWTLVFGFEPL